MHANIKNILVVDDNKANRFVAGLMLDLLGYTHDEACGGMEALDHIDKTHYDAVLMDIQMPEIDGLETTRRIRAREINNNLIPLIIIAMTANVAKLYERECMDAGMNGFIVKPCTADILSKMIEAHTS